MTDKRDLLAVLKTELSFLESGGYSNSANPWRPPFVFEDSPSCLNFRDWTKPHPCSECALVQLVPEARRKEKRPCRFIRLNGEGRTIEDFYRTGSQRELEWNLMIWLRETIRKLDDDRHKLGDSKRDHALMVRQEKAP
jgi:hypothetical protein